jgi:KDO2-lipid IV(A) lauroyltransferase
MYTPRLTPKTIKEYIEIENRQFLDEAVAEGRGVAVLTAHIGNWEWLGAGLALHGYPVASIVKSQPNSEHTKILNEYRRMAGIQVFSRGTTEILTAAKALRAGSVLGFFSDQDAGNSGVFVEFLGQMSSTPVGVAVFARKFGLPVVPAFIVRRPEGGHKIILGSPLRLIKTTNEEADIRDFTARGAKVIEKIIKQYPDEWLWFQKRWNTKWEGEQA